MLAPISDFDDPDDALRDAAAQQLVLIAEHAELASRALSIRDDPSGRYHLRKAVAHVRPALGLVGDLEESKAKRRADHAR